jgi:hypothetical protein
MGERNRLVADLAAFKSQAVLCSALCRCGKELPLMNDQGEVFVHCHDCGFEKDFGRGAQVPGKVRAHNAVMLEGRGE